MMKRTGRHLNHPERRDSALMPTAALMLLATAAMLLAACTAADPAAPQAADTRAIGFGQYVAAAPTRADDARLVERTIPEGASIGIYAYYHDGPARWNSEAAVPDFMFNQQATNSAGAETFTYAPLKYWPNESDDKVSFIAYYPYSDPAQTTPGHPANPATTGLTPLLANDGTGLPTFRYVVSDDVERQTDLLLSDLLPDLPRGTTAVVPSGAADRATLTVTDRVRFYFRHALAKVEFRLAVHPSIRQDVAGVTIHSFRMTHIKNQGTLTPTYDPAEGTTSLDWSGQQATTDEAGAHTYAITLHQPYLLLPQPLSDDARLLLDYELKMKSYGTSYEYTGGTPHPTDTYTYRYPDAAVRLNTLTATTTGATIDRWNPNTHYVYTLRLGAERIEFTGEVVDWGDAVAASDIAVDEPVN